MSWNYVITDSTPWSHKTQSGNADEIISYFNSLGFTNEAIAGLLGNMERESFLNPGQQQIGGGGATNSGYGLIQWTPSTDLTDIVGNEWYRGDLQIQLINDEGSTSRWIPTSSYPYSWSEFSQLTDYEEATKAYAYERERAGVASIETRLEYADFWYNYILDNPPSPPTPTPTKKHMPVWMMCRRF